MEVFLRAEEVAKRLGVSTRTVRNWAVDPEMLALGFPNKILIGPNCVVYSEEKLNEYQNSIKETRSVKMEKLIEVTGQPSTNKGQRASRSGVRSANKRSDPPMGVVMFGAFSLSEAL